MTLPFPITQFMLALRPDRGTHTGGFGGSEDGVAAVVAARAVAEASLGGPLPGALRKP